MCMQDWRIGRLVRMSPAPQSGNAATVTIAANQQRVGVLVSAYPDNTTPAPSSLEIAIDGQPSFVVSEENYPYMISLATHGDMPTRAIAVSNIDTLNPVNVIEFFMPEAYLAQALEEFKRSYPKWTG